ncbi:MAG: hypothetical protein AAF797_03975 [Planctomycetota bacterium]
MSRWLPPPRRLLLGGLLAACLGVVLAVTFGPGVLRDHRVIQLQSIKPGDFEIALIYFAARRDPTRYPQDVEVALHVRHRLPTDRRNRLLLALLPDRAPIHRPLFDTILEESRKQPAETLTPFLDQVLSQSLLTAKTTGPLVNDLADRIAGSADPQPIIQLLERHALWSLERVGPDAYLHALNPLLTSPEPAAPAQLARQLFDHPSLLKHPQGKAFFQHLIQHPEPHARDAAVSIALAAGLTDQLPATDLYPLVNTRLQRAPAAATAPEAHRWRSLLWAQTLEDPASLLRTLSAPQRDRLTLHLIDTLDKAELTSLSRELLLDFNPEARFAGAVLVGLARLDPQTVTGDTSALADLLRSDPSLTVETLLARNDDDLIALGLRRTDALTHAIATTDNPQHRLRLQLGLYLREPSSYPFATAITRDPANASTYLLAALHRPPTDHPRFALDTLFPPTHSTTADLESWAGHTHTLLTDRGWWPVLNRYLPKALRLQSAPGIDDVNRLRDHLLRSAGPTPHGLPDG